MSTVDHQDRASSCRWQRSYAEDLIAGHGRQRSEAEFRRLLAGAGFTLQRVLAGSGSYSALEASIA
ncbi:hypothetical protein [Micromonospora musae]|uniref:hypothetical protein n=1 Tax=Micromonospora musae TaxID=1894970 RepID=UPI0033EBDCF8